MSSSTTAWHSPQTQYEQIRNGRGEVTGFRCDSCGGYALALFDIEHARDCSHVR